MADENNTETPVARPQTEILGKLSVLSLGVPAAALADDTVNKVTMGTIVGRATGITRRTKKNEAEGTTETLMGFRGSFQAIPSDPKRPASRSGILYLPEGLGGAALSRLMEAEENGEIISLDFAMECFVVRAKNPSGYSWGGRSLLPETETAETDPVTEIMGRIASAKGNQTGQPEALTDQSDRPAVDDQPAGVEEKAVAKGGKKG